MKEDIPLAVQNLRKFWSAKKANEGITQNQAAKALGWTQSGFSHYISNITELNSRAVFKLANFLNVSPVKIDPNVYDEYPSLFFAQIAESTKIEKLQAPLPFADGNVYVWDKSMGYKLPKGSLLIAVPPKKATTKKTKLYLTKKDDTSSWKLKEHPTAPLKKEGYTEILAVINIFT